MNITSNYKLSVIIPVFNEEDNIYSLEDKVGEFIKESGNKVAVLFVNDGSADESLSRIKEVCQRNKHFYFLDMKVNQGLSTAMKAGIDYTYSEYVGYIDADLQTDPMDFNLLMEYIEDYDMVTGIRVGRKDSFVKNMSSKIANGFRRMMTDDGIEDTGCPLKILRSDIAKKIPFFKGMHRFLPALVQMLGGSVKQVPVNHFPRVAGESKYNLFNRLVGPFKDCFAFRWMKSRYISYDVKQTNLD